MTPERPDNPGNLEADLSAYVDGELPPQRAREIERLAAERPEVREELEQLRAVSRRVAALPRRGAPAAVVALVEREMERGARRGGAARRYQIWGLRWVVRISAAAAVLLGGVLAGWELGSRAQQRQAEPAVGLVRETGVTPLTPPDGPAPTPVDALRVAARDPRQAEAEGGGAASVEAVRAAADTARPETPAAGLRDNQTEAAAPTATIALAPSGTPGTPGRTQPSQSQMGMIHGYQQQQWLQSVPYAQTWAQADADVPVVDVVITPENAEQYTLAYNALVSNTYLVGADQPQATVTDAAGAPDPARQPAPTEQQPVTVLCQTQVSNVAMFVNSLQVQSPRQVHLNVNFRPKDSAAIEQLTRLLNEARTNGWDSQTLQRQWAALQREREQRAAALPPEVPGGVPAADQAQKEAAGATAGQGGAGGTAPRPHPPSVAPRAERKERPAARTRQRDQAAPPKQQATQPAEGHPGATTAAPAGQVVAAGEPADHGAAEAGMTMRIVLLPPPEPPTPATQPTTAPTPAP